MNGKREKIVILLIAFVLFMAGVWALSMDRGDGRTLVLTLVFGAMLSLAVGMTLIRLKGKNKRMHKED